MINTIKDFYSLKLRYYLWAWIIPFSSVLFLLIIFGEVPRTDAIFFSIIIFIIVKQIQFASADELIQSTKELDSQSTAA